MSQRSLPDGVAALVQELRALATRRAENLRDPLLVRWDALSSALTGWLCGPSPNHSKIATCAEALAAELEKADERALAARVRTIPTMLQG